jgi:hypothetical protein
MHHFASILWNRTTLACTAAAMATLLLVQVAFMRPAQAESVQGNSGISQATVRNGFGQIFSSPQCLWVIDDRSEMLFVYYIENVADPRLQVRWTESLPRLFQQARGR